jgi:hypothetical protein
MRSSSVTSGAPSTSANATYQASSRSVDIPVFEDAAARQVGGGGARSRPSAVENVFDRGFTSQLDQFRT